MSKLSSLKIVKALLNHYGLKANKSLGQNFLVDAYILKILVDSAELQITDNVLEVGSGLGVLTQSLAKRSHRVISLELDKQLLPILKDTLEGFNNIELICADGLQFNLHSLPENSLLVANLPYNIATAMILRALESGRFKQLVCLVQKEVAEKLCAKPNEKAFGSFSLIVQHFAKTSIIRHVKPTSFFPKPKVTSSIVRLDTMPKAKVEEVIFNLIYASFKHRRKTLRKNLLMANYEPSIVIKALEQVGISQMARAENLNLEQFKELAKLLPTTTPC